MFVNPVYANDERVLGILYQHAHTERQCMLQDVELIQFKLRFHIPHSFAMLAHWVSNEYGTLR